MINEGLIEVCATQYDGHALLLAELEPGEFAQHRAVSTSGPARFTTRVNRGFTVETGTVSLPTLEAFKALIPKADRWPISDTWAYHDWHQSGNGEMEPFMKHDGDGVWRAVRAWRTSSARRRCWTTLTIARSSKACTRTCGSRTPRRMIWMTQPAWPSNMWKILSSDYDTQSSFYGMKKACEPLHAQLDLSDYSVAVVNTTTAAHPGMTVSATVYSLDNKQLLQHSEQKDIAANDVTPGFKLELATLMGTNVVLVKLELHDATGKLVSDNLYWLATASPLYRQLNHLPPASIAASASMAGSGQIRVLLKNTGAAAALANKLTLVHAADSSRILPAYYSDNYVSLLPGETREVKIEYPASAGRAKVNLRGWSLAPTSVTVQ